MVTVDGLDELLALAGREVGVSDWLTIDQATIDAFADTTGDHQWIHVDPDRAAGTPWGGTIAHGLLTLSLGPRFTTALLTVSGFGFGLNYGYDRIRFISPLAVGARLRMRLSVVAVDPVASGVQVTARQTFEAEGLDKPVCVADAIIRWAG
jgi:acyl dehydratase